MLKVRVIPTLLWKQFGLVKGVAFNSWRRVGPALPAVKVYNQREVDELVLLDIELNRTGDEPDFELIDELGQDCFVPLTVGGGINSVDQVRKLLRAGADKISLNTAAYTRPELIAQIANRFGSQCVVASIDVRRESNRRWQCYSHSGQLPTGWEVVRWCKEVEQLGAGEILLTSIDNDGTMKGYDLDLIASVVSAVGVPVISAGGAGNYQHMIDAVLKGGASAVAAASIFHFTEQTPAEAKLAMAAAGIPIRHDYRE